MGSNNVVTIVTSLLMGWAVIALYLAWACDQAGKHGLTKATLKNPRAWLAILGWPVMIPLSVAFIAKRKAEMDCIREYKDDTGKIPRIARKVILRNGRPYLPKRGEKLRATDEMIIATRPVWDRHDVTFFVVDMDVEGTPIAAVEVPESIAADICKRMSRKTRAVLFHYNTGA